MSFSVRKRKRLTHNRADVVYDRLKQRLITGALRTGERLDVNALVAEMETSRQPVLAAISRLAAEGFLRVVPQVGCWVSTVERQEVADFFRLFALTEGLSCELAALRRTAAGLEALRKNLAATHRLLEQSANDLDALSQSFFHLNREFHGQIHDMARSNFVGDLAGGMWDRCDFYLASADPGIQGERVAVSVKEHEAIAAAIEAGNAQEARELMVRHITSFGEAAVLMQHSADAV